MQRLRGLRYAVSLALAVLIVIAGLPFSGVLALRQDESSIVISLDLDRPGVSATNVVRRSLYYASEEEPIHLGPAGIGSFGPGSVQIPFQVESAGTYRLVLTYMLAAGRRLVDVKIDGQAPASGWTNLELWPTSPDYPWGSPHMYREGQLPPVEWVLDGAFTLAAGAHTIEFAFHQGDVLLTGARLTTGPVPQNNPKPWFQAGYIPFPALVFSERVTQETADGLRITFKGTWHNLAPDAVTYAISTAVMPRNGASNSRFRVVAASPAEALHLPRGGELPFSLTVEATGQVPDQYSEMIRLDLASKDIPGLSKPYLMVATNGYLDARTQKPLMYAKGSDAADFAPAEGADLRHVIPTRETLGFKDGRYERSLTEAFLYGLATAPRPIVTVRYPDGGINLTAWAKTTPTTWNDHDSYSLEREHPLAHLLASLGQQRATINQLRDAMLLLSDEMPFYPVGRWDAALPTILPMIQYERTGATALASYVKLVQHKAVSDEEHFRFLHNVLLPLYLAYRDDLRVGGTLAQPVRAGDALMVLQRETPPYIYPEELTGDWIRIGTGETTEYVRIRRRTGDGGVEIEPGFPGPFQYDHAAGEPWVSLHMNEWLELEATEIWSFLTVAAASRDAAVIEQCLDFLATVFQTQNIFRPDGSFANEPGSYGWGTYEYIHQVQQIFDFLGRENLPFSEVFQQQTLDALIMWNEFPFSDGMHPMLNRDGATNQLPRLDDGIELLAEMFPERQDLIRRFRTVIAQEQNRSPGSIVENRSFKVDGWGYAMLRGPGAWDQRMETLLSSKHLLYYPGDHVSWDTLGIVIFAHGALMTPRYGLDWRGYPFPLLNMVRIDGEEFPYWGDFAHFDGDPDMPSAVAFTDMAGPWSTEPGPARQERWLVQLPEYLFDTYLVRPRDGQAHTFEWAYRNLGQVEIVTPAAAPLREATNPDGSAWDPFGYYIDNTGQRGRSFRADALWQADWTMNEGNISFPADYPNPPRGAKIRLSMEGTPETQVITAWLVGPGRNDEVNLRQDFVVVERRGTQAVFVSTYEPIGIGENALVEDIVTVAQHPADGARAVRVTTAEGVDWFLVGTSDFGAKREHRQIGPFVTDAAFAVVRVRDGQVWQWMFAGGSELQFNEGDLAFATRESHPRR